MPSNYIKLGKEIRCEKEKCSFHSDIYLMAMNRFWQQGWPSVTFLWYNKLHARLLSYVFSDSVSLFYKEGLWDSDKSLT